MRQNVVVSQQPLSRVSGSNNWTQIGRHDLSRRAAIVRGREAISALQPALAALSRETGQAGSMDWLSHQLHSPNSLKKDPHVVLFGRDDVALPGRISTSSLLGAVLIYEYQYAGLPTGVFATDDISGTRTVLAPASSRLEVLRQAVACLMRRNAAVVFASVDQEAEAASQPQVPVRMQFAHRTRWIPTALALGSTFDSTLAQLGARTRRNLRYYRRRAVTELGAQFVSHAQVTRDQFLALNRASTHPLSYEEAIWRHDLFERSRLRPTTLYAGMRSASGEWLSLIFGQRQDSMAEIEWQINRAVAPHHSFSIALRAFLLEHEVSLGTTELRFIGGTQHSISASCATNPVTDILAIRQGSVRGWALRHFARRLLPEVNFLRGALEDQQMIRTTQPAISWAGAGLHIF